MSPHPSQSSADGCLAVYLSLPYRPSVYPTRPARNDPPQAVHCGVLPELVTAVPWSSQQQGKAKQHQIEARRHYNDTMTALARIARAGMDFESLSAEVRAPPALARVP